MKTYYIVKHVNNRNEKYWEAHRRGFRSILNKFNHMNYVKNTCSFRGPDECEQLLSRVLNPIKPKIVRVLKI